MSQVKLGMLGLGRGATYAKAAALCKSAKITAICDILPDKLSKTASQYGIAATYTDVGEFLDSDIEAVVVATPITLHAEHCIKALEAGKHVLSEVTVAASLDECGRIAEAVKKSGKKYMLAENYCYIRPWMILTNMAKQGLLGEIYYGESDYLMDFQLRDGFPNVSGWRKKVYFDHKGHPYITHSLGPLCQLFGEKIQTVSCMGAGSYPGFKADNTCVLLCRTEKGNLIRLRNSFISARPDNFTYYSVQGTKGCYEAPRVSGDIHRIHVRGMHKPNEWHDINEFSEYLPEEWKMIPEDRVSDGFDGGLPILIERFAESILGGEGCDVDIDIDKAVNWTATGFMSEASAESGGMPFNIPSL